MKFIFINRFYAPDISATSQLLTDAAEHLAVNHEVHIVTSRLSYEGAETFPSRDVLNQVQVHRIWTTRFGREHLVGRGLDYLTFFVGVFFKLLLLASQKDVLIAKTDPPMVSIVVGWVAHLKGAKLVNWLQDLFPEVAISLGMQLPGFLVGMLQRARNSSLMQAKQNIAIGESMRNRLVKEGVRTDHAVVVPNWADGDAISPQDSSSLRSEWHLEHNFVAEYSGNFGRAHEFDTIAAAIDHLLPESRIRFLMIGGGVYMEQLKAMAFSNCEFKSYQPRERLPETLSLPDVHLISLLPELEGLILPSKMYGILAAGRPLINIGDPQGEVGALITRFDIGFNVPVGEAGELVRVLLHLADNPEEVHEKGQSARCLFDEMFGHSRSLKRLEEILCQLI